MTNEQLPLNLVVDLLWQLSLSRSACFVASFAPSLLLSDEYSAEPDPADVSQAALLLSGMV